MRAFLSQEAPSPRHEAGPGKAVEEARFILAIIEPHLYYPGFEGKEHLAYTVYGDYTNREYYRNAHADLAKSLAAILPVLDALEAEA